MKRIMLAAIVKDEAAYLPEWIAYHLALGVDHIRVFTNKIQDNSIAILKKISEVAPVSIHDADYLWEVDATLDIDAHVLPEFLEKNPFQARAMATMYQMATDEGFDHLCSIDVDEFLYLNGMSIQSFTESLSPLLAARLQWFNTTGEPKDFMLPVRRKLRGDFVPLHKLIVQTGVEGFQFRTPHHAVKFGPKVQQTFNPTESNCFIIHRYHRSEAEYISMLGKGDVLHTANSMKSNREGFDTNPRTVVNIEPEAVTRFQEHYLRIIDDSNISGNLRSARSFVLQRAEQTAQLFRTFPASKQSQIRSFNGTTLKPNSVVEKFWK